MPLRKVGRPADYEVRVRCRLSSQVTMAALSKATGAYRMDRRSTGIFNPGGAIYSNSQAVANLPDLRYQYPT